MKKTIMTIALIATTVLSCKKDNETQPTRSITPCGYDISKLKDITWHPVNSVLMNLKFRSDGIFEQGDTVDGFWNLSNGCDTIHITGNEDYKMRIVVLTDDTLKLETQFFGVLPYYK